MSTSENPDFRHNFQKIASRASILIKTFENLSFGQKFGKITILVKIGEKFQIWSKSSKNLDFIRNISILVQISDNLDFDQNFWKILIEGKFSKYLKIFEKSVFWSNFFWRIAILVKFANNLNWCQTFEFSGVWSKFSKNSDLRQNFRRKAILVKIRKNFNCGHTFSKNFDFIRSISILVQISRKPRFWSNFLKNLDWSQNHRNISTLIKIFEISQFGPKI